MFCYQKNTKFSQAVGCSREDFWASVKDTSNRWRIDSRREILDVVERHDSKGIKKWLKNTDYQRFIAKKRELKRKSARDNFFAKSDEEKLLAFAQELKDNLTAFIFSCREFDETETAKGKLFRHRRLADCHLNGLVMLDIDHVEQPEAIYEKMKNDKELMDRTMLVHVTSSKKGIRIVFKADISDGNLADNQIVFAQKLGYEADKSCIDATRNSFTPKEEDILYINDDIFTYYDEEFDKKYSPMYRDKKTQPQREHPQRAQQPHPQGEGSDGESGNQNYKLSTINSQLKWHSYDIQSIIDARYGDKLPCAADSNRHNESLKLASDLLIMLDGDKKQVQGIVEAQPWVQEIFRERDENVGQTVDSAASKMSKDEGKYKTLAPSERMQKAIEKVTGKTWKEILTPLSNPSEEKEDFIPLALDGELYTWGNKIAELSKTFPLLKEVCEGLNVNQYPSALFITGGFLMTLMTRCWYRFYHRPEKKRRLNCSLLVIGDPASGKSVATDLYDLLAEPIILADKKSKKAVNAWKETTEAKGANKDKEIRPKVPIRIHPARTSNQTFITDMVNSIDTVDGEEMHLHMLIFDSELDNTLTLQKSGSWINKDAMELKAFHNEEDGQAYSNKGSLQENFNVYWNYIYTGTPYALSKKVNSQNFGTGLPTRLTVIPMPSTNFKMMPLSRYSSFNHQREEVLRKWAFLLDKTKGELPLWPLVEKLWQWTERRMEDAKEDNSKAEEMLLKRCAYHGLNYSAPFIVMRHWASMHQEGKLWCGTFEVDDKDWELCELITNIHHKCQLHYFLAMAEKYFDNQLKEQATNITHKRKTIECFERLPDEFTIEDVMRCFGYSGISAGRTKIVRLIADKLVEISRKYIKDGHSAVIYRKTGCLIQ